MKRRRKKKLSENSITQRHLREKRKARFKRRVLGFFKFCVLCIVLVCAGLVLREAYIWGRGVFDRYYAIYQDYEVRRSEQRAEQDERFDGYTNVLLLGLDEGTLVQDEKAVAAHAAWVQNKESILQAKAQWQKEQEALREQRAQERAQQTAEREKLVAEREQIIRELDAAVERGELKAEEAKAQRPAEIPPLAPEPEEEKGPDFTVPEEPKIPMIRIGQEADTVMVLSLNNATGELRVITVPRGMLVSVPELKMTGVHLNSVFAQGGSTWTVRAVSQSLGISLHHYVEVDTDLLAKLIDTLGGMDIYVEMNMFYEDPESGLKIDIPQGLRHMDGNTVQKYLRYRGGELGEVGRLQRQQRFVRALFDAVMQPANVTKLPELTELLQKKLSTSAEIWDSAHLIKVLHSIKGSPQTFMLPGSFVKGDEAGWQLNQAEYDTRLKELFPELENKEDKEKKNK